MTTEQLQRRAEQARDELSHTIEEIEHRLSPRHLVASNPWLLVALIGAAGGFLAWLLTRGNRED